MDLAMKFEDLTMSTAFSGVDAPGVARNELARELESRLPGVFIRKPPTLHRIEIDSQAQSELLTMPDEDACVFKDVCEFFHPQLVRTGVIQFCKVNPDKAHELIGPIVKQMKAVTNCADCLRHGRKREIAMAKINF
eukprot:8206996-Pyramimonas_sp.AAC.2